MIRRPPYARATAYLGAAGTVIGLAWKIGAALVGVAMAFEDRLNARFAELDARLVTVQKAQISGEITTAGQSISIVRLTDALASAKEDRMKENAAQNERIGVVQNKVTRIETQMDWLVWQRRGEAPRKEDVN